MSKHCVYYSVCIAVCIITVCMQAYLLLSCSAVGQARSDIPHHSAPQHPPRQQHPAGDKHLHLTSDWYHSPQSPLLLHSNWFMKPPRLTEAQCWFSLIKLRGLTNYVTSCPMPVRQVPIHSLWCRSFTGACMCTLKRAINCEFRSHKESL